MFVIKETFILILAED